MCQRGRGRQAKVTLVHQIKTEGLTGKAASSNPSYSGAWADAMAPVSPSGRCPQSPWSVPGSVPVVVVLLRASVGVRPHEVSAAAGKGFLDENSVEPVLISAVIRFVECRAKDANECVIGMVGAPDMISTDLTTAAGP